ncbi:hypothetical protein Hypma_005340 [Hypsizygus marmoreus]|uniref:Uncharacterized protein n=1 Tax=Hypsizygus marmoreus TaxID=39966 RepID=A0A369K2G9_HYPMA|nr:hypothetical protein Hypma_005340 [Hypsizygus marmoreus]
MAISDMFSGAAVGWRQFTLEFAVGGTFDLLTSEQWARLFIPSTNDANEGGLGSWRVHVRYHPNSTAASFSSQARHTRNNTDSFIDKLCNSDDHLYVMRWAHHEDASGALARFQERFLASQRSRAEKARLKQIEAERKKCAELARLANVGLIVDRKQVERMTIPQLDDQLSIHKKIFNDEILLKVLQKELKSRAFKLLAVLAAITRNEERILLLHALLLPNRDNLCASSADAAAIDVTVGANAMRLLGEIGGAAGAEELAGGAVTTDSGKDYMEEEDKYYEVCR